MPKAAKAKADEGELPAARSAGGDTDNVSVGGFRFWFVGQQWEWSDEVARMHGYEPGSVEPTTELLLSHKHPDDRAHVQDLLDEVLHSKSSFSSRHRFIDIAGKVHDAIVVADRRLTRPVLWWEPPATTSTWPPPSSRTAKWPLTRRCQICSRPAR